MSFIILLILAYGPLQWSFPWWLWVLGVIWPVTHIVNVNYKGDL